MSKGIWTIRYRCRLLPIAVIWMSMPLFARQKTDVIVMNNGDRLTCEIKQLNHGVLYASLDYIDGTITIDWSKVKQLESDQLFTVETVGGSTYAGRLRTTESPEDQPRRIEIVEDPPQQNLVVEQSKIVQANQYDDSFWHRMHGSFSSGVTYNKSNNNTQYNLGSDLSYLRERSSLSLSYDSVLSNTSGTTATTRNQVNLKGERLLRWDNWYYEGTGIFLESSAQGINSQTTYGGGIGRYFINTNSTRLQLASGLGWQDTFYADRPTQNDLVFYIEGGLYLFRFKKTDLTVAPVLFPSITDGGRIRFNLNAKYKIQIISDLWWSISLYGNWDNRPPVGFTGTDYGTSMGLTYSFH